MLGKATLLYLSVTTRTVIGQFSGPHSYYIAKQKFRCYFMAKSGSHLIIYEKIKPLIIYLRLNRSHTIVHMKNLAVNLPLNQGPTILHTKNLAVNLRLNRGHTILHTKKITVNLRLNRGLPILHTKNLVISTLCM